MAPPRYQPLGPLHSGAGSRAHLALAFPPDGAPHPCVLIYLHPDVVADPHAMEAVRRETRRAEHLEHPHLIRVFGLAEQPEGTARVVEYADGESVRAVLDSAKHVPAELAARIAVDAATGLHYAHVAGNDDGTPLVHGDVRPETLILAYAGHTKVGGYGALAAAPREAGGRRVRGRRQHCAPEQVVGGREAVNIQTDVYLLGVLLFELLSGKVPFADRGTEFDTAVLTAAPPPLPILDRPAALEAVIRRAMAKKAFDRYPTPLAFREAVERAVPHLASHEEAAAFMAKLFPADTTGPRLVRQRMLDAALAMARAVAPGMVSASAASPAKAAEPAPPPEPAGEVAATPATSGADPKGAEQPAAQPVSATATRLPMPPEAATPALSSSAVTSPRRARKRRAPLFAALALLLAGAGGYAAWQTGFGAEADTADAGTTTAAAMGSPTGAGAMASSPDDAGAVAQGAGSDGGAAGGPAGAAVTPGPVVTMLDVFVDPPVDVAIDGAPVGRSPVKVKVDPGRHTVRLTDGGRGISVTRVVDVPAGGTRREYYLSRGYVNVVAPDGAEIIIDGKSYGRAPLKEIGLYEGSHRIVVTIDGVRWQQSFELKGNERVRFDVEFE